MPRSLVVYFSQGGTTARVAEAITAGLRIAGYEVDLSNIKDKQPTDLSSYELLGIGSHVNYYRPPFNVTDYLNRLPKLNGLPTFTFLLYGTCPGDSASIIRRLLARKGAREVGYFHCLGGDYFLGYLKHGYLFSPGHPTERELDQAKTFGREVAAHIGDKHYAIPENDQPFPIIYRLERAVLASRWLGRNVYSRFFKLDAEKCTRCGVCVKLCPTKNIAGDKTKFPSWGHNCLMCLTCELKCPTDAVRSPINWPLFSPFLVYNVHRASRDPSLSYVRVIHNKGHTREVQSGKSEHLE